MSKLKDSASHVGDYAKSKLEFQKEKFMHSSVVTKPKQIKSDFNSIKNAKGIKGKSKAAFDVAKGTKSGQAIASGINKTRDFYKSHKLMCRALLIVLAISSALGNVYCFGKGIAESYGYSPHYYCDSAASSDEKDTEMYKQYCKVSANGTSSSGTASVAEIEELGENIYLPYGSTQCDQWWARIHADIFTNNLQYYAGDPTTCTNFAHWRFWLQYGYDAGSGNGKDMAASTHELYPDKFGLVDYPVAGSIVSFSGPGPCGHVGFIEKVDGDYVWWSDGNVSGGGIRFNTKMTIEEFKTCCGSIQVANPLQ